MEYNDWGIGIHKEINVSPVKFDSARMLDVYYNIVQRFNYQLTPSINITKQELYKIANFEEYFREPVADDLIAELCKSSTFEIPKAKGRKIYGSVFTAREELDNTLTIWVSEPFRPYIFHKNDIDIINKVKHKKELKTEELEYWDRELKEKKQFLLLLNQAEVEGIRSKYGKRLYGLLVQYQLKNKFYMSIENFRAIMEIPEKYTLGQLNGDILKRVKKELETKGLFKFLDEPKGKGKRKITHIEISFEYLGLYKAKKSKEDIEKEEFEKKKLSVFKKASKLLGYKGYILTELEPIDNYGDLDRFIEKHKIIL
ncbi:MAG: replication initiation protein [Aliarcobacter sp.]|mgnify:FL=1|nr:replication initiation protein [Aliarcobacter sp.]